MRQKKKDPLGIGPYPKLRKLKGDRDWMDQQGGALRKSK
jgi:hypothetical protein